MSIAFEEREERPAMISFELRPVELKAESLKAGKAIYADVEYVHVTPPYSRDIYVQQADKWFSKQKAGFKNGRIPKKFLDFWDEVRNRWRAGLDAPVNGTDIKNWSAITPSQTKMLIEARIYSIEDLANAPEDALSRIGMGGIDLRNKAQAYIKTATNGGALVLENAEQKKQIIVLQGSVSSLEERVKLLTAQLEASKVSLEPLHVVKEEITADDLIDDESSQFSLETHSERDILAKEFKAKFGRQPHSAMGIDKLREKLS